jgi:hypothetical protein
MLLSILMLVKNREKQISKLFKLQGKVALVTGTTVGIEKMHSSHRNAIYLDHTRKCRADYHKIISFQICFYCFLRILL